MVLGFYLRTRCLPDAARFKLFVGAVLLYLAWRLLAEHLHRRNWLVMARATEAAPQGRTRSAGAASSYRSAHGATASRCPPCWRWPRCGHRRGPMASARGDHRALLHRRVRLPVALWRGRTCGDVRHFSHRRYGVHAPAAPQRGAAAPDWALGSLFGLGGLLGTYLGAATQKHVPQRVLPVRAQCRARQRRQQLSRQRPALSAGYLRGAWLSGHDSPPLHREPGKPAVQTSGAVNYGGQTPCRCSLSLAGTGRG